MKLPNQYRYLNYEPAPKMLLEALKCYGIEEILGPGDSPAIIGWAEETGHRNYVHDATAWCGLFISVVAKRSGWVHKPKGNGLWARNWASWGTKQTVAMLGDVLVFPRGEGGHVTIYVGEDKTHYHCLGGNQSDRVNIVRKLKKPIIAIRRAAWKKKEPANVRVIPLNASGPVSVKEA